MVSSGTLFTRLPEALATPSGQRIDFDASRLRRDLFEASGAHGHARPLLARELTDGALHFLAQAVDRDPFPLAEYHDAVVTAVRELGYPAIALAYERRAQEQWAMAEATEIAYPPDLAAAEAKGLLQLPPIASPYLEGGRLQVPDDPTDWSAVLTEACEWAGTWLALRWPDEAEVLDEQFAWLQQCCSALPTRVLLHIDWPPGAHGAAALEFADWLLQPAAQHRVRVREAEPWLSRALAGERIDFVFDKPLANDAEFVLGSIGLGLDRLDPHGQGSDELLYQQLATLAHLAGDALAARRNALRHCGTPAVQRLFRLDRAQGTVVPRGIDGLIRQRLGLFAAAGASEWFRPALRVLHAALERVDRNAELHWNSPALPSELPDATLRPEQLLKRYALWSAEIGGGFASVPGSATLDGLRSFARQSARTSHLTGIRLLAICD